VKDKARKEEARKRVSWTGKTIESPASIYSLVNAGEPFNSSSPAIPSAIDKRIIQDSRLFSFSFLFSILLFFHHDDFTFVEIEFPLNGRRKGKSIRSFFFLLQRSAPHQVEDFDWVCCEREKKETTCTCNNLWL
jgi:hypothetical protein